MHFSFNSLPGPASTCGREAAPVGRDTDLGSRPTPPSHIRRRFAPPVWADPILEPTWLQISACWLCQLGLPQKLHRYRRYAVTTQTGKLMLLILWQLKSRPDCLHAPRRTQALCHGIFAGYTTCLQICAHETDMRARPRKSVSVGVPGRRVAWIDLGTGQPLCNGCRRPPEKGRDGKQPEPYLRTARTRDWTRPPQGVQSQQASRGELWPHGSP